MLDPTKKDTPCPRAKENHKQDSRRGKIAFRIKPRTHQRFSESSNKVLWAPGPRDPTETEPDLSLCVFCGGTCQQWPALGTMAVTAADLGHTACGISHLEGDLH